MAYHDYRYSEPTVYKKYVDVVELRKKDGTLEPLEIVWSNGQHYKIDKSEFKQYGESKAGSGGKHYIVWINGEKRNMYLEKDKWFIESYKTPKQNNQKW